MPGKKVHKVLIEQNIYYKGESDPKEFYISILLNRKAGRNMIIYSPQGGMSIEDVAATTPELIFTEEIDPKLELSLINAGKFHLTWDCRVTPIRKWLLLSILFIKLTLV